jgi:hypothetical protein
MNRFANRIRKKIRHQIARQAVGGSISGHYREFLPVPASCWNELTPRLSLVWPPTR